MLDPRAHPAPAWRPLAVLLLITAGAAGLRLVGLDRESLWYDELIMARITDGSLQEPMMEVLRSRPPLYTFAAWGWTQMWGTSEFALRSLSALSGLLAVPLMYRLGRRLFDPTTGLIAATLTAASAFMVYYSQEHRYYALYMLMSLASLVCLAEALLAPRRRWFAGFVLFTVLSYYGQYFAVFTMAAGFAAVVLLWRALSPGARRGYVLSVLVIGVGMLPGLVWPLLWLKDPAGAGTWRDVPPWWSPIKTSLHFLFLAERHTPRAGLLAAAVTGGLVVAAWVWHRGPRQWMSDMRAWPGATWRLARRRRIAVVLLACWWLVPLWAMLAASWLSPMYVDRYLIASAPAMFVLLAAAITSLHRVLAPAATTAIILVALAGSLWTLHTGVLKDQWRETAGYLAEHVQPDDTLAFASYRGLLIETQHVSGNIGWYWPYRQRGLHVDITRPDEELVAQLRAGAGAGGRVWLVMMVWADEDMPPDLVSRLTSVPGGPRVERAQAFYRAQLLLLTFPPQAGPSQSAAAHCPVSQPQKMT